METLQQELAYSSLFYSSLALLLSVQSLKAATQPAYHAPPCRPAIVRIFSRCLEQFLLWRPLARRLVIVSLTETLSTERANRHSLLISPGPELDCLVCVLLAAHCCCCRGSNQALQTETVFMAGLDTGSFIYLLRVSLPKLLSLDPNWHHQSKTLLL